MRSKLQATHCRRRSRLAKTAVCERLTSCTSQNTLYEWCIYRAKSGNLEGRRGVLECSLLLHTFYNLPRWSIANRFVLYRYTLPVITIAFRDCTKSPWIALYKKKQAAYNKCNIKCPAQLKSPMRGRQLYIGAPKPCSNDPGFDMYCDSSWLFAAACKLYSVFYKRLETLLHLIDCSRKKSVQTALWVHLNESTRVMGCN